MNTKTENKMQIGSTVRVAAYSVAEGGFIYGDTGTVVQMFAAVAVVDFGNKIKKVHVCQLIVV